jgi:uncharacterized radical SAM protein YgiQ
MDFLPVTPAEVAARGWDAIDVVFVSGDAYVDHPSFAAALLGRVLEAEGYRVAILSQPDWRSCDAWRSFGRPRLCFAVSAGNMDSMLNHYTASRKVRNDDAYSPGGQIGRRPDRATLAYCQRAREAYPGVPVIAGGVEASLRRLTHYDFWSDKVRRSILMDSKADLVVFGMGERPLIDIIHRLDAGHKVTDLRDMRSVAYRLGASESVPPFVGQVANLPGIPPIEQCAPQPDTVVLPSYEEASTDKRAFAAMTRMAHHETNPYNARRLVQYHGREAVVVNPPDLPLTEAEMDHIYDLPFARRPHPMYGDQKIPAYEVVKTSIQIMRGCFGGCTFCSITAHQGRIIQSRSQRSVLAEIGRVAADPANKGIVSDLGGPTANMYKMGCSQPAVATKCRRLSCVHPTVCKLLNTNHEPLLELMRQSREQEGIRRVFVASGVRTELARRSPEYIRELAQHHTGGLLKVAPEHADDEVLRLMKKPCAEEFTSFAQEFQQAGAEVGKKQHLVPYFIAGHPGSDLAAMIRLAQFLKRTGYRPDKVQDFIPGPMDIATCMFYTGLDPMTGKEVYVARGMHERRLQRALMQYWKPENYAAVREALEQAGHKDLIGDDPECLIAAHPPKASAKRSTAVDPPYVHAIGYRPHRKSARRRDKR